MLASGTYEFWNELLQGEVESPTIRFAGRTARYGWKQNAETIEVGTRADKSRLRRCCTAVLHSTTVAIRWVPSALSSACQTPPLALPKVLLLLHIPGVCFHYFVHATLSVCLPFCFVPTSVR